MRILRGVGSELLPCGCFVGLYETYSGPTVQIVEERGVSCGEPRHEPGVQVVLAANGVPRTPSAPPAQRPAA
jgi:hypothetical protein